MTALLAAEIEGLRETVREVCSDAGGPAAMRRLADDGPGFDPQLWDVLGRQVGLAGLGLPEQAGGVGGLAELAAVGEELGRALLPVPFLTSTVLSGQVLANAGALEAVARVAAGEVAACGLTGPDGCFDPTTVPLTSDGSSVDGVVSFVPSGAALLVVAARTAQGIDLFLVDTASDRVHEVRMPTLDLSRPQSLVTVTDAPATQLTFAGSADAAVLPALDVAAVVLAAEQLGGAQACLDMAVAYLKERRQFGRAIGSFQALKHTAADLLVLVETCRSAVVRAVESSGTSLSEAAAVAQSWCSEAFCTVAAETVQLHGGIGFTWEHDAHLYFRRARADAALLGGAAHHRERLARMLGW